MDRIMNIKDNIIGMGRSAISGPAGVCDLPVPQWGVSYLTRPNNVVIKSNKL